MANLYRPGAFQGTGKKKDYFEGWYFKSVDREEKNAFAVIAGISICRDASKSHAFIMFFDARGNKMIYFKYPASEFQAHKNKFEINIGRSFFSSENMRLDLDDGTNKITADLRFEGIRPWPVSVLSPGVMGWYRFVPLMECYHANISLDHKIKGVITQNGRVTDLTGGKGYIEKDWGKSMPQSWIWMQTNHFEKDGVSLFGSIAKIPWLGNYFTGYIFGFLYDNRLYKFTAYNGSKVDRLFADRDRIEIFMENREYYLEIKADRTAGVDLPAPKLGEMTARVNESLRSVIEAGLYKKTPTGRDTVFIGKGRNSGLEFVGDIKELLRGFKK
jgi:hypothetical protein